MEKAKGNFLWLQGKRILYRTLLKIKNDGNFFSPFLKNCYLARNGLGDSRRINKLRDPGASR
jgi:hypothetical protein